MIYAFPARVKHLLVTHLMGRHFERVVARITSFDGDNYSLALSLSLFPGAVFKN